MSESSSSSTSSPPPLPPGAPDVSGVIKNTQPCSNFDEFAIDDDLDASRSALADFSALADRLNEHEMDADQSTLAERLHELEALQSSLAEVSKGVSEQTFKSYENLAKQCLVWLREHKLIGKDEEFFSKTPSENAPLFISAWIMDQCDELRLDGKPRGPDEARSTHVHAQKMRAACTFFFGRVHRLGDIPWHQTEQGAWRGNPSCSIAVSTYMISLKRRKVRAGDVPVSSRAMTPDLMQKMYDYNHRPEVYGMEPPEAGTRQGRGSYRMGGRCRRMLMAAYTIAFICLLRFDEVLKIQFQNIWVQRGPEGIVRKFTLTLPFRKTDQFGGIRPFVVWMFHQSEAHLCAVSALAAWISVLLAEGISEGYVFRQIKSGDRINHTNTPMTSAQFLELFRNNLLDVGVDCDVYGTHSFRRGGCQYLASKRRWPLRRICEWGGWSTEFSHLTIVKYLISNSDEPEYDRDDFFNPHVKPVKKCFVCGRSCDCA